MSTDMLRRLINCRSIIITGFLTTINCLDVKLSARSQFTMTFTSITTLVIISISGVVWSITGRPSVNKCQIIAQHLFAIVKGTFS